LTLISCTDLHVILDRGDRIVDCFKEQEWDEVKLRDAMVGNWEWEFVSCFWTPEHDSGKTYLGLSLEFKGDSTLIVRESGDITQVATWYIEEHGEWFKMDTDPPIYQLYGFIYICGPKLQFIDSGGDGCDNYFRNQRF
jgi:hypothetical protein